MRIRISARSTLLAAALVAATSAGTTGTAAHAEPTWAPATTAPIHPGVQTNNASGQCTANFVFYDSSNNVYIGQAAHCTTLSGSTVTNGCQAVSRPINTPITIGGATRTGTMVYNSWIAMQAAGEPVNSNQCRYNDFALVKLDPADYGRVNPSVPFWGGPGAINTTGTMLRDRVFSYGNSSLRLGITTLSPKTGISIGSSSGGWTHSIYTASPGIPGDSGSAVLDKDGKALGVLATLSATGSNGVGDISRELDYLRTHSSLGTLQLALGTVAFHTPA